MDHSCPSCGLAVADGTPFCPGCRAPQIRFVPPEPVEAPALAGMATQDALPAPTALIWQPALHAAFVGGAFSALVMNFLGGLLGLGVIGGGIIAVYVYRRKVPGAVLGLGSGSLMGALSGFLGFLLFCMLATVEILLSHTQNELRRRAFESMDKVVQNADPQLQQQFQELVQQFKTPEGFVIFMVFTCVLVCVMFVFFSTLGGAIGANITRRNPK